MSVLQTSHLQVEAAPTSGLTPNPDNARTHLDKQIMQIAASIERFGFLVPIVVDKAGMIIAGHGRWLGARKLGLTSVPVVRAEFLSEDDRRAFALADNKLAELSGWDDKLLQAELNRLFDSGYGLDLTGFTTADLDFSLPEPSDKNKADRVELPDPSTAAVARAGDLWQVGPHRLFCGDAREVTSCEALLGGELANIVFADPPYNVPIEGFVSGSGQHREFMMGVGEMSPGEFTAFLRAIFRMCARFSTSGSIHYHCMDWRHTRELLDAADGIYTEHKQIIVWDKQTGGMGTFYRSQHELVFVFKSGRDKHVNTFGLGETGRYRTNVVRYAGANTFRKGRKRDLADHSTIKPTALIADFLLDCSHRGDLVLDPCLGSGSTLIAAHRTGRRGAGIELDPLYVDTALRRLSDATGLIAVLVGDGRTFAEVAVTRAAEMEG